MKWPVGVIAQIALEEWPNKRTATVAVAVCLSATDGDDSFSYQPGAITLSPLLGAWAIPWMPEMEATGLNAYRLRDNAKLARMLCGPKGDDWEWSTVYRSGNWLYKMDEAKKGIDNPRAGITQSSPIPVERFSNTAEGLQKMAMAAGQVLQDAARFVRQPLYPRK